VAGNDETDESSESLLKDLMALEHHVQSLEVENSPAIDFDVERMLSKLTAIDAAGGPPNPSPATRHDGAGDDVAIHAAGEHEFEQQEICPNQLGEYQLMEVIGRGGIGTVYRGRHQMLGREVAIKRLRRDRDQKSSANSNHESHERFRREMKVLGALDCPHIVTVNDARTIDGEMMLVMELIQGVTLRELVRQRGPLPIPDACEIIRQTCVGLSVAHASGIVHRDLKPANVMLSREGIIKVLDFGLASLRYAEMVADNPDASSEHPSLTSPSTIMGTVDYISPEQIDDARRADSRSDIYSLGCLFYLLLTGKPPFSQEDYPADVARLMAHVSMIPKPVHSRRPETNAVINDMIAKMLGKTPDARPRDASAIAETIAPFCEGHQLV